LDQAVLLARRAAERIGRDRLQVAPSCSMLHVPIDASLETGLPPEIHGWLAFAKEKIGELRVVADALNGLASASATLELARERLQARSRSGRVHRPEVAARVGDLSPEQARRKSRYAQRRTLQQRRYGLPPFPTTTIGSFPQTSEVRKARAAFRAGRLDETRYVDFLEEQTARCVTFQEQLGIDVLVHGEFERNDMVEYFGEQLEGFAFTRN